MPTSICEYIGASLGSKPRGFELVAQDVLDLAGDVADQRGEAAGGLRDRGVAHQDAEPVGRGLDVVEQGEGGPLEQLARVAARSGRR